jgi:hypothetical protein
MPISDHIRSDLTGRAGEHYVAAALNRMGVAGTLFAGHLKGYDLVAIGLERQGPG